MKEHFENSKENFLADLRQIEKAGKYLSETNNVTLKEYVDKYDFKEV